MRLKNLNILTIQNVAYPQGPETRAEALSLYIVSRFPPIVCIMLMLTAISKRPDASAGPQSGKQAESRKTQLDFVVAELYILKQSGSRFARPFPSLYVSAEGHRLPTQAAFCRPRRHILCLRLLFQEKIGLDQVINRQKSCQCERCFRHIIVKDCF